MGRQPSVRIDNHGISDRRWRRRLFPILSYCEAHCRGKDDAYQNRYIGFLAEHLMSAYFARHEGEYKIVHAEKRFVW